MAGGDGGKSLGVSMSNPLLDGLKVPSVIEADTASAKLGFYGVTAIVQPAGATQATITASWATLSGGTGFGFDSSDAIISVIANLKQIATVLKTTGIWKGTA